MISKKMKYAIKALCYLGEHSQSQMVVKTQDISNYKKIPKKFLEQILLELKKAKIVNSKQGNEGGYFLLKNTKDINLADIYRVFEGPIALIACASENFYQPCEDCMDESNCKLKKSIITVRNETLESMKKITIFSLQ